MLHQRLIQSLVPQSTPKCSQNTRHVIFAKQYDSLLDKMSPLLRGEAALRVAAQSIGRVPYFSPDTVEDAFLATAALKMHVSIYSLREYIPLNHLTIIERGMAASNGRLKIKGTAIGHDMILELPHLRDWAPVIALTVVVQVMTLKKEDLQESLLESPRALKQVKSAAFKLAFQRLVTKVAFEYKMAQAESETGEGGSVGLLNFVRLAVPDAVARAHSRAIKDLPYSIYDASTGPDAQAVAVRSRPQVSQACTQNGHAPVFAQAPSDGVVSGQAHPPVDLSNLSASFADRSRPTMELPPLATTWQESSSSTPTGAAWMPSLPFFPASPTAPAADATRLDWLRPLVQDLMANQERLMQEVRACRHDISRHEQQTNSIANDVNLLKRWYVNDVLSQLQA